MQVECLITGCALVVEDKQVWGDLYRLGNVHIFNACTDDHGESAWDFEQPTHLRYVKALGPYWERRGTVVFACETAVLSEDARQYLGRQHG